MNYELSLSETNKVVLDISLPSGLTNVSLKLIDFLGNEVEITDYTLKNNVLTYNIPSEVYEEEGTIKYYVVADNYESEDIEINIHLNSIKNSCQIIEITSGNYCVCVRKKCSTTTAYLKELSNNPIGDFTIWEGNYHAQENGTFQWIAIYYGLYNNIIERYPLYAQTR